MRTAPSTVDNAPACDASFEPAWNRDKASQAEGSGLIISVLRISLLGDLTVERNGQAVPLPRSRKTRALLAFLVVTARPHRRDRLCEMFWELPDDPRGALRWSLSKLRAFLNDPENEALVSDRERVGVDVTTIITDIGEVEAYLLRDAASANSLTKGLKLLQERPYLAGLDEAGNEIFDVWIAAERERVRRLQARATQQLVAHPDTSPDLALTYAQQWVTEEPYSVIAADALVRSYERMGDHDAARIAVHQIRERFAQADILWDAPKPVASGRASDSEQDSMLRAQEIRFCKAADGATIAYATVGSGPPLVKVANWLSHLELDWDAPIWSPLFRQLARNHQFIRYDERGNGLSDWKVSELSQDAFVADLEAVVDAVGVGQFPLLGISQGAAVAIEYASRHPERVSKLILFGGYPVGWRIDASDQVIAEREAVMTLTRSGWGREDPAYRHLFSATFMPSASAEQLAWFDEFQRLTTSPENASAFLSAFGDIDVREELAAINVPTLVLHSRGDKRVPWETARDLASKIPNARFVTLESENHLLLENEPAAEAFVREVEAFLAE